jgi:phosphoglycolate phosphatase-like HAD superfamily hydrolase
MKLADLLGRTRAVLLDFDGPVCALFAGRPMASVAADLHAIIGERLGTVPAEIVEPAVDPVHLLRRVAALGDAELSSAVADALRAAELAAVATARPTPGARDVFRTAQVTGRRVGVVSNHHGDAVEKYLHANDLLQYVDGIAGRCDGMDPRDLMPDPLLVRAGLTAARQTARVQPAGAVLVGDSASVVEAARAAGVPTVGYANQPGTRERLAAAGADIVVETLDELADALRMTAGGA